VPAAIPEAGNGTVRTFAMPKIFIDTNILVYSLDQFEPQKQKNVGIQELVGDEMSRQ
jgi:hypothetical protein